MFCIFEPSTCGSDRISCQNLLCEDSHTIQTRQVPATDGPANNLRARAAAGGPQMPFAPIPRPLKPSQPVKAVSLACPEFDQLLHGGLRCGSITELTGTLQRVCATQHAQHASCQPLCLALQASLVQAKRRLHCRLWLLHNACRAGCHLKPQLQARVGTRHRARTSQEASSGSTLRASCPSSACTSWWMAPTAGAQLAVMRLAAKCMPVTCLLLTAGHMHVPQAWHLPNPPCLAFPSPSCLSLPSHSWLCLQVWGTLVLHGACAAAAMR